MRVTKKMINELIEKLNGFDKYELNVFWKQGLDGILTIKQNNITIVDKSMTNKNMYKFLSNINYEFESSNKETIFVFLFDKETEIIIHSYEKKGTVEEIFNSMKNSFPNARIEILSKDIAVYI